MNDNWTTIEQAAVTLGLSVRTVNRHITAGKLQSRLNEGRREVLIDLMAGPVQAGVTTAHAPAALNGGQSSDLSIPDYETVLALADNAADKADMAVSAFQTLARSADERIHSTRRAAHVAWSLVGMMVLVALVSVGWTSHELTRAAVEADHLQRQVSSATAMAGTAGDECNDLRRALAEAREEAARAEGRLAAETEAREAQPATGPSLVERIASVFEAGE